MSEPEALEPISPLRAAAAQMHEMYVELRNAGFSRRDALDLVARVVGLGVSMSIDDIQDEEK